MLRRRFGMLSGAVVLLVAAATGLSGGVASAGGDCTGNCVLGVLEQTGPPPVPSPTVGAGATSSLTFTLANDTSTSDAHSKGLAVGAADLTAPTGFAILSAMFSHRSGGGTVYVKIDRSTVPPVYDLDLDSLDLAPGASLSVVLSVSASCAATSGPWTLTAEAKGASQQSFTVDPSSALAVGVTGACTLAFAADPTNAVAGQDISSRGFDPGGSPVRVRAAAANGHPLGGVDVTLGAELGSGALGGTTSSTTAGSGSGAGLASFSPLSIGENGYYFLEASAPAFLSADSSDFQITGGATACTGSCSGSASGGSVSAAVTVNSPPAGDTLSVGLGGFSYQCPDWLSPTGYYPTYTGAVGVDLWLPDGALDLSSLSESVSLSFPEQLAQPPPWFFPNEVCYASTEPFVGGSLASAAQSIPGYASSTYIGLLPYCPSSPTSADAPCVVSSDVSGGTAVVTFLGAPGDFWGSA